MSPLVAFVVLLLLTIVSLVVYILVQQHTLNNNKSNIATQAAQLAAQKVTLDASAPKRPTFFVESNASEFWKERAKAEPSIDINKLAQGHHDQQWYYDGKPTCVGTGFHTYTCPSNSLVCSAGDTFGPGSAQLKDVAAAINTTDGKHPACPFK